MKYLHWRGRSLWCRFPVPGKPERYPLGIKRFSDSKTEINRCLREGELELAALRTRAVEAKFFENLDRKPICEVQYNPKFWRLVGRYWYYHLCFSKSGRNERYHLAPCLKKFGNKYAKDITREDFVLWRQELKRSGFAINTINNICAYFRAVFSWSNKESLVNQRIMYDPCIGLEKLKGGNIRSFLLTQEKFERNYLLLRDGLLRQTGKRNKHMTDWQITPCPRFALFYLALWELGRRPEEASLYTWEMVTEVQLDGRPVRYFSVPPVITKTDEFDTVIISERLWIEMNKQAWRTNFIFLNAEGQRWRHWSRHKEKLESVFGKDGGWIRDTRRGFVTHKTEVEGMDSTHVRMQSGHRTQSIFDRYRIGQLRNQAAVINGKRPNFGQTDKSGQ